MFVVIKQGTYMQGVYGPFPSPVIAEVYALAFALTDKDSYHDWVVHEITSAGLEYGRFSTSKEKAQERLIPPPPEIEEDQTVMNEGQIQAYELEHGIERSE